jgi:hypothetical protein
MVSIQRQRLHMLEKSNFAVGGINATFPSQWPLEETRRRLAKLARWTKDCPDLTGSVTADHVKLSVSRLSRSNGTAFRGQIKETNGEVVLEGRFSTSAYTQGTSMLSLLWLAAMAIGLIAHAVATMVESGEFFRGLASVLAFIAALMGFGALMLWNASPLRKDVARLTEAIEHALGKDV